MGIKVVCDLILYCTFSSIQTLLEMSQEDTNMYTLMTVTHQNYKSAIPSLKCVHCDVNTTLCRAPVSRESPCNHGNPEMARLYTVQWKNSSSAFLTWGNWTFCVPCPGFAECCSLLIKYHARIAVLLMGTRLCSTVCSAV